MKIEIGKFVITSDSMCFTLNEKMKRGEKSKEAGEEYLSVSGYYTTLEQCLNAIPTKALMQSDCESLADAKTVMAEYRQLITESLK
jgi:hypothetical protein